MSERLERLAKQECDFQEGIGENVVLGVRLHSPNCQRCAILRRALPQIVAVVEAAETFSKSTNGRRQKSIQAALAALDAALTADGNTPK